MARFVLYSVILLFAVTSLVSSDCNEHTTCDDCLAANVGQTIPDNVCLWCFDPASSTTDSCQAAANFREGGCNHSNFALTCSFSALAALIIIIIVVVLVIACCCGICCCLIALCVRAANSNRRSQVTYTEFA